MGTISDKLTYLNTTKTMLRDSLNKFGTNILTTNTFRSYDTKLNDIYNKLPKITQSGAGLTITPVQNGQVDDFKMIGVDLEQETVETITVSDWEQGSIATESGSLTPSTTEIRTINYTKVFPNTLYSISRTVYTSYMKFRFYDKDKNYIGHQFNLDVTTNRENNRMGGNESTMQLTINDDRVRYMKLTDMSNDLSTVYTITTNATPSPNYPQEIKVVEGRQVINVKGKNLLKPYMYVETRNGITTSYDSETNTYTFNGTCTEDNTTFRLSNNVINFTAEITKSITYWVAGSCSNYCYIRHFDSSYILKCMYSILDLSSTNNRIEKTTNSTFVAPNTQTSIRFNNGSVANNFQIKVMVTDDDNTDYELYHDPVDYIVNLNLENIQLAKMPNTNYKNRIYKNNGNWYYEENAKKFVIDGSENWVKNSYSFYWNGDMFSNKPVSLCSHFVNNGSSWTSNNEALRGKYTTTNAAQFKCMPLEDMTLNEFKTWLSTNNVDVWCQLDNPITTQITNTTLINQLEAISVYTGTNIITISNSNNIIPEIEITRLKELEKLL